MSAILASFKDNCSCRSGNMSIEKEGKNVSNKVTDSRTLDKFLITFQRQSNENTT